MMRNADKESVGKEAQHRDRGDSRYLIPLKPVKLNQLSALSIKFRNSNLTADSRAVNERFVHEWFVLAGAIRAIGGRLGGCS